MSQYAPRRLYLMQVGIMPEYQIPIVCYLVQTGDGKNILIDSGLPEIMPEGESEFENGQDVIEQLASIGLKPADIDTRGIHAGAICCSACASCGCGEQPAFCCHTIRMGSAHGAHSAGGR